MSEFVDGIATQLDEKRVIQTGLFLDDDSLRVLIEFQTEKESVQEASDFIREQRRHTKRKDRHVYLPIPISIEAAKVVFKQLGRILYPYLGGEHETY